MDVCQETMNKFDYSKYCNRKVKAMSWQEQYEDLIYLLHSEDYVRRLLYVFYKKQQYLEAREKSYDNYAVLIQHIKHGVDYFSTVHTIPFSIKPTLLYYGLIHFLKACMLLHDPNYPRSTSVLAHGVTTRKKKKKQYDFLSDDVKIQSKGLLPLVAEELFHVKLCIHQKYSLLCLLRQIVELAPLFQELRNETIAYPLEQQNEHTILISQNHYTYYVKDFLTSHKQIKPIDQGDIQLSFQNPISYSIPYPFTLSLTGKPYVLTYSPNESLVTEMIVHYLLLYYLSMLSRYDASSWLQLVQPENDEYILLLKYLTIATQKIPLCILNYIEQQKKLVNHH